MLTLFDIPPELPDGFSYYEDFIRPEEETALLALISRFDLANMQFHQYEAKRKVISFGSSWSFTEQQLKEGAPIPTEFDALIERISQAAGLEPAAIVQQLITEYPPGAVINWHRDAPPYETVIGLSLQADCIFKVRPYDKALQTRSATISFPVKRRSLYIMRGEAKTAWEHSTAPLKKVRYSMTFRTVRPF